MKDFKGGLPERLHKMRGDSRHTKRISATQREIEAMREMYERLYRIKQGFELLTENWLSQSEVNKLLGDFRDERRNCTLAFMNHKSLYNYQLIQDFIRYAAGVGQIEKLLEQISKFQEANGPLSNALTSIKLDKQW